MASQVLDQGLRPILDLDGTGKIAGLKRRGLTAGELLKGEEHTGAGLRERFHDQATPRTRSTAEGSVCCVSICAQASRNSRTRRSTSSTGWTCLRIFASVSRRV